MPESGATVISGFTTCPFCFKYNQGFLYANENYDTGICATTLL
jgi:hypothetical protein